MRLCPFRLPGPPRRPGIARALAPWLAGLAACGEAPAPPPGPAQGGGTAPPGPVRGLPELAAERGLTYVNVSGDPEKTTILAANGAGVALLDLAGDGDLDAVFAQGLRGLEALVSGSRADLEAYENDGSGRFERVPGPGLEGWWTGLATGDLDGDGRTDLVAGGYGDLAVLVQDDRGRLLKPADSGLAEWFAARPGSRLAPGAEEGRAPDWFTSLALLDADRDGALDLYAGRYLDLDPRRPPRGSLGTAPLEVPCTWKGHEVYCGPRGMQPQADVLFAGDGSGAFVDRTATWLPALPPAFTLAVAPFDADMDGDTDLYVANDSVANRLLVNELRSRPGTFVERALGAGVAVNPDGVPEAGMGIAVGDIDGNGLFDLVVTNFSEEPTHLYLGAEVGYSCATYRSGLAYRTRRLLSWSAHLVDMDGDGRLELFTANGHVYPQADREGTGTSYAQADSLFGFAVEKDAVQVLPFEHEAAGFLDVVAGSRGSAVGDLNGDGAPDLVVNRIDGPAGLGLNGLAPDSQRLVVRCLGPLSHGAHGANGGPRTPPDARGTRLVLETEPAPGQEERAFLAEVQSARGYQSASSDWISFGLGASPRYRSLTLLWPSGRVEKLPGGEAGVRLTVREGVGIIDSEPLR